MPLRSEFYDSFQNGAAPVDDFTRILNVAVARQIENIQRHAGLDGGPVSTRNPPDPRNALNQLNASLAALSATSIRDLVAMETAGLAAIVEEDGANDHVVKASTAFCEQFCHGHSAIGGILSHMMDAQDASQTDYLKALRTISNAQIFDLPALSALSATLPGSFATPTPGFWDKPMA